MIHIFDVDQTVIKKNCAWYFIKEALDSKFIRFSQIRKLPFEWLMYKIGKPNVNFIEEAVKYFAGKDKKSLEKTAEDCFQKSMKHNIYEGAAKLIREALARGEKVIFATSSFDFMIQPLEQFFGIEGSVASKMEFIGDKMTGKLDGESCFGEKKMIAVEKWLKTYSYDAGSVCFYSDSYTDLPLLEICGKAVAVNPDRILAKKAKIHGWTVLFFKKTA